MRSTTILRLGVASLFVLGVPCTAPAQPDLAELRAQVMTVRGFDAMGSALGDVSGFAVGGDFVVTNAQMLRAAASVVVVKSADSDAFDAEVDALDRRSDVAVLRVEGLSAAGVRFAAEDGAAEVGDGLYLPRFGPDGSVDEELSRGSISELRVVEPSGIGERSVLLHRHNVPAIGRQYGMPMFNRCGEVINQLRTDPDLSATVLNTRPDPGVAAYAVAAREIVHALNEANAEVRRADEPCLGPEALIAATRREADEARREAEDAQRRLRQLEADNEATEAERDEAREEAEASRAEADAKEAERAAMEEDVAETQALAEGLAAEARHLWIGIVLGAGATTAAVLALLRLLRRRREQLDTTEEELKKTRDESLHPASFSCLFKGVDDEGRDVALRISAEQLGSEAGVIVGRDPEQAEVLLEHEQVSRRHFRVIVRNSDVLVEDLNSTNGTFVNDARVEPGAPVAVADGARIDAGKAITLTLHVTPTAK